MFESIMNFFKKMTKKEEQTLKSKDAAKERLHLVLMQDRANVSADFLDLMKQEIIEVIKKYIDIDESAMDVRLTNKENGDGVNGAPALYANIPILNIKNEARKIDAKTATSVEEKNKSEEKTKSQVTPKAKEDNEDNEKENIENKDKTDKEKDENKETSKKEKNIDVKSNTTEKEKQTKEKKIKSKD